MSIFEDKKFPPFGTCAILKKSLEKRVLPLGIMGQFFTRDLYTIGKNWAKLQLFKKFLQQWFFELDFRTILGYKWKQQNQQKKYVFTKFFEVCLLGCKRGRAMVDQLGGTVSKDFSKCQLSPRYKPFALSLLNLTFY